MNVPPNCGPRKSSFAREVRMAARRLQDRHGQFSAAELKKAVDCGDRSRRAVQHVLCDLRRSGAVEVIERGVYRLVEKDSGLLKREVMWRFLRMERSLTPSDLQVAADVSLSYAQEFLAALESLGIVRRHPNDVFHLIKDQLEAPENEAKARKLRDLRTRRRAKLALALKKATIACSEAIRFLEESE